MFLYPYFTRRSLTAPLTMVVAVITAATLSTARAEHVDDRLLTLKQTVNTAQRNDPWLAGNKHQQNAIAAMGIAAGTMDDPRISIGLANLATDRLNFAQEGMTQVKLGISQMLPRGDTLAIKQQQLAQLSSQHPHQRQDRKANIAVIVSHLWLDSYQAQRSINLIEQNRALFEQLADIAQANYASAIGKTRQQDIVRAQLELTRLEDRLTQLHQQQETATQQLSQWLSNDFSQYYAPSATINDGFEVAHHTLPSTLPDIALLQPTLYEPGTPVTQEQLYLQLTRHPAVKAVEQKIKASHSAITLAKQKYQPQWGVNASYGYRDNTPAGGSRSDFLSVGVSFDLPLFTNNRQDQQVQAAVSTNEAIKTQKWLLLRQRMAAFKSARAQLLRLNQRLERYQSQILVQTHEQAEASLTAYTNDDGDFAEVARARIGELNSQIDTLAIAVQRQKVIIQLNYYFSADTSVIIANHTHAKNTNPQNTFQEEQQ
ncbi:MAG: outer membrane protein TolC [Alteromonadaceae bacterium]|jgi:outer membrane protein TolC